MSTKIEVQTERWLCCSYRFVCFNKRFHNESAMLTGQFMGANEKSPIHDSKRNEKQWLNKEAKQNGI